ncbi:MAG: NAD(P)H-dependent oxidoreductase subunit E [Clostridiales bacterium]|nr:NAD(P)H-dependent oxidoreductase subunit E [Clostridiales bacterium]
MSNQFKDTPEQKKQLDEVFEGLKNVPGSLMKAMQKAQDIYGYLPIEIMQRIAVACNVAVEEVYGIATFYAQFNIEPMGKYKMGICLGTACYVKGSGVILDKAKERLHIEPGHTTEDMKYTLEATRCIGCCGLAPVLTVNGEVYGNLVPEDLDKIFAKYEA